MLIKVKDRRTGLERTVTPQAYAAKGSKVYEKLGTVNDDGSPIAGSSLPNSNPTQVSRSVNGAAPVVVKTVLASPKSEVQEAPAPVVTPDAPAQVEETQSEPATETATADQPKRRGPKPGFRKKAISSESTSEEQ